MLPTRDEAIGDGQVAFLYAHWGQLFYIDIGLPVQASALPGGGGGGLGGGGWGGGQGGGMED
jgi:hypothetical protein